MIDPLVGAAMAQAAGSIVGAGLTTAFGDKAADDAWKRQKKVLKNQIQWRVEDAVKAGLHPLAALGVNPAQGPAAAQIGDFGDMGAANAVRTLDFTPESVRARANLMSDLQAKLIEAQIGEIKSRTVSNVAGAGSTAAGTNMIGNTMVPNKDKNFADTATSAWSDGVASVLGWLKFFEHSWNTGMAKQPPVDWLKRNVGRVGSGVNMGVPEGYRGRR